MFDLFCFILTKFIKFIAYIIVKLFKIKQNPNFQIQDLTAEI